MTSPENMNKDKDKFSKQGGTWDKLKNNKTIQSSQSFFKNNREAVIVYAVLTLGVLFFIVNRMVGGLMVGFIFGLYYYKPMFTAIKGVNNFIEKDGLIRTFVLGSTGACLLIAAPSLFVGAAAALATRILIKSEDNEDF